MNRLLLLIPLTVFSISVIAQTTVKRTPFYEVFSSSTCPPCKPANDHLSPIFEEYRENIAVVKYQMSWPGSGDPYYTPEGNGRRGIYSVTGVPYFVQNGENVSYASFDGDDIDDDLEDDARVKIELRYMLDPSTQSVSIKAHIEALDSLHAGAQRIGIIITERINHNNVKTNGETEFHNVFKKMLPASAGDFIIGKVVPGQTFEYDTTYVFQGDYRLPNNANDPINTAIEHSVEDFDSLHVIVFMQSAAADKEVYQAGIGEAYTSVEDFEREWGSWPTAVEETKKPSGIHIYPNPSNDRINIASLNGKEIAQVKIFNPAGQMVKSTTGGLGVNSSISVQNLPTGMYIVSVNTGDVVHTKSIVVQ
ncbi:MAG TPA: hypothetical protein DCX14_01615 [Flavobacteriales bacterium]|nr:hypothetical protein [Flavobacteriales bacterium]